MVGQGRARRCMADRSKVGVGWGGGGGGGRVGLGRCRG